jgi:hypothetical protein
VTGAQFSGVDIDLLADYVGGALDGTPDETVVAGLVADDPAWRDAYDALTVGMESVGAELRLLGAEDEPMPADVVLRLNAALAELPPLSGSDNATSSGTAPSGRHLVAVPDEGVDPWRERAARRDRRRGFRRWAAPVAVAAGVVIFAGIGFGGMLPRGGSEDSASSTAADQQQAAPMLESAGGDLDTVIATSGLDYGRDALKSARLASKRVSGDTGELSAAASGSPTDVRAYDATETAAVLQPLLVRNALLACLEAITAEHGAGPITPTVVDYASFEGKPALVVQFTASDGGFSWVSGPKCGTPGSDADTRYQVRVG